MSLYLGTTPIANDGSHNTANVDLSNLSNTGEAHFANPALTNSPYTTNRILEIPQDIKLELNNGTLTLKAGSKVYVPNGFEVDGTTPKFDVVTTAENKSLSGVQNLRSLVFHNPNDLSDWPRIEPSYCFSGTTAPSGYAVMAWYDTASNLMKITINGGSDWTGGFSLPYVEITETTIGVSIDQVFNGFGYIGSTVFALPGVKVQIPNGRNEDGTCKSVVWSTPNVQIKTYTSQTHDLIGFIYSSGFNMTDHPLLDYMGKKPTSGARIWLDTNGNMFYYSSDWSDPSKTVKLNTIACCEYHISSGKITSLTPYDVDSVVNSNASNFSQAGRSLLSGLGMPSSRYIDLTLGASGSTYTAPANGWFVISKVATGVQDVVIDLNGVRWTTSNAPTTGWTCSAFVPCKKNDTINVFYSAGGALNYFRFIYAEGAE